MNKNSFRSSIEDLITTLDQADALLTVAMNINIAELNPYTSFNFISAINNSITRAKLICERLEELQCWCL